MRIKIKKIFTRRRIIKIIIMGIIVIAIIVIPCIIAHASTNDSLIELQLRDMVVEYAKRHTGIPYQWGGDIEDMLELGGLDCSGFTQKVYLDLFGVDIGRTTWDQVKYGKTVNLNELEIGDLIFTNKCEHVGIYVGNGEMINAVDTGDVIRTTKISKFFKAKRIIYPN